MKKETQYNMALKELRIQEQLFDLVEALEPKPHGYTYADHLDMLCLLMSQIKESKKKLIELTS